MPRALLVDDDEQFLAALAEAVARHNFTTQTAMTLKAAKAAGVPSWAAEVVVGVGAPARGWTVGVLSPAPAAPFLRQG